jgi:Transposase DDE domain group 1
MQLSHTPGAMSAGFDGPNLVSAAGLVPVLALAESVGLATLARQHLSVPTDKGANAGVKVAALVGGMVAGADSIDDMRLLRHGGMRRLFTGAYAPSTLGSFLRSFQFGHVRQLDAVAARVLAGLAARAPLLPTSNPASESGLMVVDVDDTIVEVHGYAKQGAAFGYSKMRGLNALLATASTPGSAPVIVAQRLRKGSAHSARGAKRLVTDALRTVSRLTPRRPVLLRADSAFYGADTVTAAVRAGAQVSVTVRQNAQVKAAIAQIGEDGWIPIAYREAVYDEVARRWISRAEVAEIPHLAFPSKPQRQRVAGRLVVRRIPELNPTGQDGLFDVWRFHAFFTTSAPGHVDTVAADRIHRGHAIIEQVHADLKHSALAHLPSGNFAANAAWLVLAVIAFNLTRTAATLTGSSLATATTGTLRRTLIAVPARIATSARRVVLHIPQAWPWQDAWRKLFHRTCGPPSPQPT